MRQPRARVFKQARWDTPTKEECVASRLVYGALNICATDCFSFSFCGNRSFWRGLAMFSQVEIKCFFAFCLFVAAAAASPLSPLIKYVHVCFNWTSCVAKQLQKLRFVSTGRSGRLISMHPLIMIINKQSVFAASCGFIGCAVCEACTPHSVATCDAVFT